MNHVPETSMCVSIRVGHKAAPRPFGRLDIGTSGLRLWCWPLAWFKPREARAGTIEEITVEARFMRPILRIHDTHGVFGNVILDLTGHASRVIHELRHYGYTVADHRTGTGR